MTKRTKEQLFRIIVETGFAIDDVVLFLDTHPEDREAMEYYQHYRRINKEAVKEYTECYGPITADNVDESNYWAWVKTPWPWEGEC